MSKRTENSNTDSKNMADVEAYLKTVEERLEHLSAGRRLAITIERDAAGAYDFKTQEIGRASSTRSGHPQGAPSPAKPFDGYRRDFRAKAKKVKEIAARLGASQFVGFDLAHSQAGEWTFSIICPKDLRAVAVAAPTDATAKAKPGSGRYNLRVRAAAAE